MKRIYGLFLLLLSVPWLANAAALESAADQIAHSASIGEHNAQLRLQIISKLYPKLIKFLMKRYSDRTRIEIPGFEHGSYRFAISPSNSKLIIVPWRGNFNCNGQFIIWDLKMNKLLHHIKTLPVELSDILITSDEKKVIFTDDRRKASIWDMNRGCQLYDLGEGFPIALNHDSSKLVTASWTQKTFRVWDVETGRQLYQISNRDTLCPSGSCEPCLALSADGTKVANIGHWIHVFDLVTGRTLFTFDAGHDQRGKDNSRFASSVIFSPDETQLMADLYSGFGERTYCKAVWSLQTGEQLSITKDSFEYNDIVGNKKIKKVGYNSIAIYDNETGQFLCAGRNNRGCAITDHLFVVTGQKGKAIYVYDLDALTAFQHVIASLSDRQLWLIDQIRNKAEHKTKFVLNVDNPKLTGIIYDYGTLPDPIKDIEQDHVIFMANQ